MSGVTCHTLAVSDSLFRRLLALCAGVGLGLRVGYVFHARPGVVEGGDAETYRLLAELLADGEGYIRPREFLFTGERIATAEFPPLWPMVLAVLDVVGFDTPNQQRAFGAVIGCVTVVVVGLLAAAVADRRVGGLAAGLAAISPQLIVLDGSLHAESLAIMLVSLGLLGAVRGGYDRGLVGGRRWWLLASVAFGLAALARSETVLVAIVVIALAARPAVRGVWLRTVAVGLVGVVVCLGAWTVRNAVSLGDLQPLTNNSGTLIAGSNCDAVYGGSQIGLWRFDCVLAVDTADLDESAAAAARRSAGIDHALDHVSALPAVGAVRVLRTFGLWDIRSQIFFESLEGRDYDWMWAGWFGWLVVAAAAVVGTISSRRRRERWPERRLLLVPIGVVMLTALVSYGNQRFRAIAEPGTLVLAAIGIRAGLDRWRRRAGQGAQAPTGSS